MTELKTLKDLEKEHYNNEHIDFIQDFNQELKVEAVKRVKYGLEKSGLIIEHIVYTKNGECLITWNKEHAENDYEYWAGWIFNNIDFFNLIGEDLK